MLLRVQLSRDAKNAGRRTSPAFAPHRRKNDPPRDARVPDNLDHSAFGQQATSQLIINPIMMPNRFVFICQCFCQDENSRCFPACQRVTGTDDPISVAVLAPKIPKFARKRMRQSDNRRHLLCSERFIFHFKSSRPDTQAPDAQHAAAKQRFPESYFWAIGRQTKFCEIVACYRCDEAMLRSRNLRQQAQIFLHCHEQF